ncbi:MAG: hypothetical protein NW217_16690 [Hyphomicrobiaceae bacterium]|nr:hypothetical protein [Hyphomicrobiaceae bacterium]
MMRSVSHRLVFPLAVVPLAAGLMSGCGAQLTAVNLTESATGALAAIPKAASQLSAGVRQPVGTATEVYTRVARGALTCWMGAHGPLKGTHLFQADAEPAHKGGRSEIALHERIADAPNKPGRRVYAVTIEPHGERATVEAQNLHLPPAQGDGMHQDVQRWAANEEGCLPDGVTAGWEAQAGSASEQAAVTRPKSGAPATAKAAPIRASTTTEPR